MSELILADSLPQAAVKVREACERGAILNLTIRVRCDVPRLDAPFFSSYRKLAEIWQSADVPPKYMFTHGQFMHRAGDALDHLVHELQRKSTSNRACVSLVNMADIIVSEDGPLPSFMLLQAGFEDTVNHVLYVTAYYRALEVESFLPINVTELAIIVDKLVLGLPQVNVVEFNIHAFRAHAMPNARPLERADLDVVTPDEIGAIVRAEDRDRIVTWLSDKARPETLVDTSGLSVLTTELDASVWASRDAVESLKSAITAMVTLEALRQLASHAHQLDVRQEEVAMHIQTAISKL